MFTKTEPGTNFNFTEVLQDYCYLHILLVSMKEKKVTPRDLVMHGFKRVLEVIIQKQSHN